MSRKPESRFIDSVHRQIKDESIHIQAMSSMYSNGTPDRYYEGSGGVLWVEYKYLPRVPRDGFDVAELCSDLQRGWLSRAHGNGVPVRVIVGSLYGGFISEPAAWKWERNKRLFIHKVSLALVCKSSLPVNAVAQYITELIR